MPFQASPVASDDEAPKLCKESVFGWPELNAAAGSLNLVKSLASAFSSPGTSSPRHLAGGPSSRASKMSSFLFGGSQSSSLQSMSAGSSGTQEEGATSLATLPDELLSMCYSSLSARDLVSLELVSRRLRDLVAADDFAWKECAKKTWSDHQNFGLMNMAAVSAGGWKRLFAAKSALEAKNPQWIVPSSYEVQAMLECSLSGSPRSIISGPAAREENLNIVLLVDGSSSVTEIDFDAQRNFCIELVNSVRSTHPTASIAVLQFNQYPKVHSGLTNVSKQSLVTAIQTMQQMMGSTDIAAPIRRARQMLAEDSTGTGEKAIVILTDGQTHSDELREADREARQAALDSGARLFALGVGRDVDETGLRKVACGTSDVLPACLEMPMSTGHYFPLRKMRRG